MITSQVPVQISRGQLRQELNCSYAQMDRAIAELGLSPVLIQNGVVFYAGEVTDKIIEHLAAKKGATS